MILRVNENRSHNRIIDGVKRWTLLCGLVIFSAACGGIGDAAPTPTQSGDDRSSQTQAAPEWIEAAEPITLNNVTDIRALGRLDAPGQPSTVFAYALSPDSTQLAGLNNEQLLIWDLISGELIVNAGRLGASYVYYSPDKAEVYTLNAEGGVVAHESERGTRQADFRAHADFSGAAAFHADDGWLALGGIDGTIRVWDPTDRRSIVTFNGHTDEVLALTFSSDGERLASAGADGTVKIWDWRTREALSTLNLTSEGAVGRLTYSPADDILAVATDDQILLISPSDDQIQHTLSTGRGGSSDTLRFSPDGRYVVNGGVILEMQIWDAETGDRVADLPGIGGDRVSAAFSPDGDMLITSVLERPVALWDMTQIDGETLVRADLDVGTTQVLYSDWTTDGFLMLFFDARGPIHVWGIEPTEPEPGNEDDA